MYGSKVINLFLAFSLSLGASAHEGHDIPGAIPPAPHGGTVLEATDAGKGHNHHAEDSEIFFEVVYKAKEVKIYPLVLTAENTKTFTSVSAEKDLSNLKVKIEVPRTKKTETLKSTAQADVVTAPFDAANATRFFVHISADYKKHPKTAKVQVETK